MSPARDVHVDANVAAHVEPRVRAICAHTYTHAHIRMSIHMSIHLSTHTSIHMCLCACPYACPCACLCTCRATRPQPIHAHFHTRLCMSNAKYHALAYAHAPAATPREDAEEGGLHPKRCQKDVFALNRRGWHCTPFGACRCVGDGGLKGASEGGFYA